MLTETLKSKLVLNKDSSIVIYLLNDKNCTSKICGLTMLDWVKKAVKDFPLVEFDYNGEDLIEFLKPRLINSDYIVVLFSNTPLITAPSVIKIMEYVKYKQINACKFNGGFAFNVEYLKNTKKVMFDSYLPTDDEDFYVIDSKSKLICAEKILKNRIINKHISNGVEFIGDSDVDALVQIGKGVTIFGGNVIKGNTFIDDNTILKEKNIIENCVIGKDVCISSSTLTNSKIEDNVFILPYCYVIDSTIRKNCYISSNIRVEKRTVRAGSKLKEN